MRYFRTGDPEADFLRQDLEQAMREERLPVCDKCKERIHDDDYYDVEGEILCEDCMKEKYRRSTEDYVEAYNN
jgi:formylmethanofuran dehydrogenase subunit E